MTYIQGRNRPSLSLERVWFGPRFLAFVVDSILVTIVWSVGTGMMLGPVLTEQGLAGQPDADIGQILLALWGRMSWMMTTFSIAVFAYYVLCEALWGMTPGKRMAGIRSVLLDEPSRRGLGLGVAFKREFIKVAGMLPGFLMMVAMMRVMGNSGDIEKLFEVLTDPVFAWLNPLAQLLPVIWLIWIAVSLAREKDPIYDKATGVAVVQR